VRSGSPADDAGLEAGDVVTEIDGEEIADGDDLRQAVAAHDPGDKVELTVESDGDSSTITATLGTRPS
jgi:putative serine protease PepD